VLFSEDFRFPRLGFQVSVDFRPIGVVVGETRMNLRQRIRPVAKVNATASPWIYSGGETSAATGCSDESAFVAKRRDRVNTCCTGGRKKPRE
jgi:hypothetical protein